MPIGTPSSSWSSEAKASESAEKLLADRDDFQPSFDVARRRG